MDNRFRRLPPRIEPRYETQPVSEPPPLHEVRETIWSTPAGAVSAYEQVADAIARKAQHGWRRRLAIAIFAGRLLFLAAGAVMTGLWIWSLVR